MWFDLWLTIPRETEGLVGHPPAAGPAMRGRQKLAGKCVLRGRVPLRMAQR